MIYYGSDLRVRKWEARSSNLLTNNSYIGKFSIKEI